MVFMWRQRVKDLLLRAPVVVRTSNMKISRRRLADYVKTLHQKAWRTCSTIIFLHSTNQIIDLWRCRWCCRSQILNSLLFRNDCGKKSKFPYANHTSYDWRKSFPKQSNFVFLVQMNSWHYICEATTDFTHFAFSQDGFRSTHQLFVRFFWLNPGLSNR